MGEYDLCVNLNYGWIWIIGGGTETQTLRGRAMWKHEMCPKLNISNKSYNQIAKFMRQNHKKESLRSKPMIKKYLILKYDWNSLLNILEFTNMPKGQQKKELDWSITPD